MKITIVSNNNGLMTKSFNKKMEKTSVSQLSEGSYKVKKISSLEDLSNIKKKLKPNQALILGTPIDDSESGKIFSRAKFKGEGITRTKDMFHNKSGLIMFDFDLRNYTDISLSDYRDMLIKCDPQLANAEMFLTYGSSAGISSKDMETGWGSVHAYCRINKEMFIKPYAEAVFNNGLNLNYGEIKVNEQIFRGYINGIVDLAVLKADASRIIYEAAPQLHKKLKRKTRKDLYFPGEVIDGSLVKKTKINTMFQSKINDIVNNLKKVYKATSKDHKDVKRRKIERKNEIYASEKLTLNNGKTIKARELLIGNYCDISMRDPFEPEKGRDKAKAFETDGLARPAIHSFVHGGQMYYVHLDLASLPWMISKIEDHKSLDLLEIYTMVKRDIKGYEQDKAVDLMAEYTEKSKQAIKKHIKQAETIKTPDLACSDEGFIGESDTTTEEMRAMEQLDNTFFILEGKHPVYAEVDDRGDIHYYTPLKLREIYRDFNDKDTDFINEWIESGHRKKIKGIRFDPSKDASEIMPTGYFNLWRGYSCDAVEGDIQPFLDYTKDIICSNDDAIFEYLLDYLAHIIQQPSRKEGVACILKGEKGTGKDTWINAFASLFDRSHYLAVNNMDALTGRFNIHLQNCLICNVGEAFFSGNHAAEGALKTLITEHEMYYEQKGLDAFGGLNYTRVFMSTNLDWVVPASGNDERRYLVLQLFNKFYGRQKEKLEYMDRFRIWLSSGGREALLHFLLEREITHDMYHAPQTNALVEQKEHSLRDIDKWIYDCAMTDTILGGEFSTRFFNTEVSISEMYDTYKSYSKDRYITSVNAFSRKINQICDPINIRKHVGIFKVFKKKAFSKSFKEQTGILISKAELGSLK